MNVTDSRLTCERCHGIGYVQSASGKDVCGECMLTSLICDLKAGLEIVYLETNRVPAARRKLGFAIVEGIKQKAGLELIGYVRTAETVDETLDSYFFRGKANGRHYVPPRRRDGLGSLAVLPADSSRFRRHIQQGEAAKLRLLIDKTVGFFLGCLGSRKSAFETIRFTCLGELVVNGKCPGPLVVFNSREDVDHTAFVFEPFHLPFKALAGKKLDRRFDKIAIKETLRFAKVRHDPSEIVSNHQESPRPAEKRLALVKQTRTIGENTTGLAGSSPVGFDFSIDRRKDRAVVKNFPELANGKSGGPFPNVKTKINLHRLDGHNEFVGAGCALHLGNRLQKICDGSRQKQNSICKPIPFLRKSFAQTTDWEVVCNHQETHDIGVPV